MALLIPERTLCRVCGDVIHVGDEVVSLPVSVQMGPFSDCTVHRACMALVPQSVRNAWWDWWQQMAHQNGGCTHPGVLAFRSRRSFSLILRDEFLVLEEQVSQLRSLTAFLRNPSPSNAPSDGWLRYRASEQGIAVDNPLTEMAMFKGLLSEARRCDAAEVLVRLERYGDPDTG